MEAVPAARVKTTSAQASASIRGIFLISSASLLEQGREPHNKRQTRPVEAPENEKATGRNDMARRRQRFHRGHSGLHGRGPDIDTGRRCYPSGGKHGGAAEL
jgi:hypothetical protein